MKNCPNCGRQVRMSATFCTQCGARFEAGPPAEQAPPSHAPPPSGQAPPNQTPPPEQPPAQGGPPASTPSGPVPGAPAPPPGAPAPGMQVPPKRSSMQVLGVAAATVVVLGGLVFALTRGGGDDTTPAGADDLEPTPFVEPTPVVPTAPPGAEFFVRIMDIEVQDDTFVVAFQTFGYEPILGAGQKHVHFFFDTVPPEEAGVPGGGPWALYPDTPGEMGASPYTGLGPADVPEGATALCTLVANDNHSVIQDSGTCYPLP